MQKEQTMTSETPKSWFYPVTVVCDCLADFGWVILGSLIIGTYIMIKLKPHWERWQDAREAAQHHKDPDTVLSRMEAVQRAREKQQQMLIAASERALQQQKEREERKRQETAERLKKYGTAAGGRRLGSDDEYLPLSGGESSTSSYRAPKRSKCGGGGCGK